MDQNGNHVGRNFGHCELQWEIRHFCMLLHDKKESLNFKSPDFYVRSFRPTKWRLRLKVTAEDEKCKDIRYISFELERLEYNGHFQLVFVDCKIGFYDMFNKNDLEAFRCSLVPNSKYETEKFAIVQSILLHWWGINKDAPFQPSFLKIKLQILVYFPGTEETFSMCSDPGIKKLSEDLQCLHETGEGHDITFIVNQQSHQLIRSHRSILYSRIQNEERMQDICKTKSRECPLDYSSNYGAWKAIIRFLYSADMNHVVTEPSLGIYESALDFGIEPIITYYMPDKLQMYSTADVEEYNLTWTIRNFFARTEAILSSPPMTTDIIGIKCRLKIYTRGFGNKSEWTGLFIEIEAHNKDICVDFFADFTEERNHLYRSHKRIMGREILGNKEAVERITLQNYLQNGSLTLGFRLRISPGTHSSAVGESTVVCKLFSEQLNYIHLSKDMLSLYENLNYTDTHIPGKSGIMTPVHSYILSARCTNGLLEALKAGFPSISEMLQSNAFQCLLLFLYCGKLNVALSVATASLLLKVAEQFHVRTLKNAVLKNLEHNLKPHNARRVHDFAMSRNIDSLRKYAAKHLRDRSDGKEREL